MKLVNLTPHPITVAGLTLPPSGFLARCEAERHVVGAIEVDGVSIPLTTVVLGEIQNLPDPVAGTIYIVSLHVALKAAREGRVADILVPDETVRDADGRIVGCRSLARQ